MNRRTINRHIASAAHSPADAQSPGMPAALELWDERTSPRLPEGLIDLRRIVLFLRRNIIQILLIAAVLTALGTGGCLVLQNNYTATALVMIDPRDAKVTQTPDVLTNIGPDAIAIESLVQVANSNAFLGRVVDRMGLMSDPAYAGQGASEGERRSATIDKLRGRLTIDRRGTTYLVDIAATTKDPERSAALANTAATMLVDDQAGMRSGSNTEAAAFLNQKLDALRERLHNAEEASAALKAKLNITDAGQGETLQERRIAELNQQLVLATARAAETKARAEQVSRDKAAAPDRLPASLQSPVLSALREDYARLTRQMADQRSIYGDRYPGIQSLAAQVTDSRRQIAAEIGRIVSSTRSDAHEAADRVDMLTADLRRAQADSGRQGSDRIRLDEIDREARADRAVYEQLLDRQKQLSELRGFLPTDVRVASSALPPARPNRPKLAFLVGAFAVLGLATGCLVAIARETFRRTITTRGQAEKLVGVEVLGLVPDVSRTPPRRAGGWESLVPDLRPWMEDIRRFAAPRGAGQGRVVLVTSTHSGEGKTTLARNLARSLAETGDKVLLLEASRPFPAPAEAKFGLLDVLAQGCAPEQGFVPVPHLGITRLPFGRVQMVKPESLDGTLNSSRLLGLIRHCHDRFDVVIIDGPSIFEAGYAATLASVADLSLVVIAWDATDGAEVVEALDRLRPDQAALVFNKVDVGRYARYEPMGIDRLRRGHRPSVAAA